jgi:predicted permease
VRAPERLVNLAAPGPNPGSDSCNQAGTCEEVFSLPMFRDLAGAPSTGLAGLAAHRLFLAGLAHDGRATQGQGVLVSGSYFPVLGLVPALGRLLGPSDDVAAGAHPVAVVSHAYWTTHLGADPAVLGRTLLVNGRALTVVGVAPRGFEGTTLGVRPWIYVPLLMAPTVDPFFGTRAELEDRTRYWTYVFGRLRPGVTRERAQAGLTAAYRPILATVEAPLHPGLSAATRSRYLAREVAVTDGRRGQATLRGATRTPLVLLFAITGLVVLIASANVASLLLVRGAARATEIAVRASLGASRGRLAAQLLVEAGVLAALGGAASVAVAYGTLRLVGRFLPDDTLGFGVTLSLGLRPSVLLFAGGVALGTGLLFALLPALHATRPALVGTIRAGAGQIAGGARAAARFRTALVTVQIALAMALLGSAGLLVRSLRNLAQVDLGLETRRVVQLAVLPELSGHDAARSHALLARLEDELAAMPGVEGAAVSSVPLVTSSSNGGNVRVEGFVRSPDTDANVRLNRVGRAFFHTMGVPLLAGRAFGAGDRGGAPRVAVVTEAFVRKFGGAWGAGGVQGAVGRRMALDGSSPDNALDVEIVGVVRDARYNTVRSEPPPLVYLPYRQDSSVTAAALYVRSARPTAEVLRAVPAAVARVDRTLPVGMLKPLDQQVREHLFLDRLVGTLAAGFALLATLLAAVGLYGVLAHTVAQRTREIGVRMALGADAGRVRRGVLAQMGWMLGVGAPIGVAVALLLGRVARSLLFGLAAHDPLVLGPSVLVLALAALTAAWVPAWRASRVSPASALRGE